MKKILIICLLLVSFGLFANEFKLLEFRKLAADFHAERNSVEDMDRDYCAALKVELDTPLELDLKQKVYKKEKIDSNSSYFFVTHQEKQITFTAPQFEPLTVDVPEAGLKKGVVFYVKLETIPDVTVTLNISPEPDRIILNSKIMQKNRFKTAPGRYALQIEKTGYETVNEQISIDAQNSYFSFNLAKIAETQIIEVEKIVETTQEPATKTGQFKLERFEVIYEVIDCEMYENQIVINLKITNIGDDRDVKILGWGKHRTRIFDDAGNEFFPQKINFANKSHSYDVEVNLVSEVPTTASLIFKEINKKASSLAKLELGIWTEKSDNFRMTFRDIPIKK